MFRSCDDPSGSVQGWFGFEGGVLKLLLLEMYR